MRQFIFKQENKSNWEVIKSNCENTIEDFSKKFAKDFTVKIGKYSPKRSDKQLRSYWMLIHSVQRYMQDQGNNFTNEEISDWFKIKANHYRQIGKEKIPKSISSNSSTTVDEMKNLINLILDFGLDHNIQDCHIEPEDLQKLLTYYR